MSKNELYNVRKGGSIVYLKYGLIFDPNSCEISFTLLALGSRRSGAVAGTISFSLIGELFPMILAYLKLIQVDGKLDSVLS